MERVLGIGGHFLRATDTAALAAWYVGDPFCAVGKLLGSFAFCNDRRRAGGGPLPR